MKKLLILILTGINLFAQTRVSIVPGSFPNNWTGTVGDTNANLVGNANLNGAVVTNGGTFGPITTSGTNITTTGNNSINGITITNSFTLLKNDTTNAAAMLFGSRLYSDGTSGIWDSGAKIIIREDEFLENSVVTPSGILQWTVSVNSGQYAMIGSLTNHPGVKQFSTLASASSAPIISQYINGLLFGSDRYRCGWLIQTPAAVSDGTDTYMIFAGFGDTATSALSTDAAYIVYKHDINSGNWLGVTSNNGTTNAMNVAGTTVAFGVSKWFYLETDVNSAGTQVDFYVNRVLIGSSTLQIPNTAARNLGSMLQITKIAGTTARTMLIDYYRDTCILANPRF